MRVHEYTGKLDEMCPEVLSAWTGFAKTPATWRSRYLPLGSPLRCTPYSLPCSLRRWYGTNPTFKMDLRHHSHRWKREPALPASSF